MELKFHTCGNFVSPQIIQILYRGNDNFLRSFIPFLRSFISFLRSLISFLRENCRFPWSYLGISSEELHEQVMRVSL